MNIVGMTYWNLPTDPYDNNELVDNFKLIDNHNHEPGRGLPIGRNAIEKEAINNEKIAKGGVTGGREGSILLGSITGEDLANNTIGANKLESSVFNQIFPIGTIVPWFRPTNTINTPTGFQICIGQTLVESEHEFQGGGSVTLPDLRNKFILGADPNANGNSGPNNSPGENVVGGSNSQNLSHSHTINAHSHEYTHFHTLPGHNHGISTDGNHHHTFAVGNNLFARPGVFGPNLHVRDINTNEIYVDVLNCMALPLFDGTNDSEVIEMDSAGAHNHGGVTTTNSQLSTLSQNEHITSSVGLTTNAPSSLPTDFRPNFIGLLFICKVKG